MVIPPSPSFPHAWRSGVLAVFQIRRAPGPEPSPFAAQRTRKKKGCSIVPRASQPLRSSFTVFTFWCSKYDAAVSEEFQLCWKWPPHPSTYIQKWNVVRWVTSTPPCAHHSLGRVVSMLSPGGFDSTWPALPPGSISGHNDRSSNA